MTGKVIVMDHPLITHKINYVRQENVGTKEFREVIGEISTVDVLRGDERSEK